MYLSHTLDCKCLVARDWPFLIDGCTSNLWQNIWLRKHPICIPQIFKGVSSIFEIWFKYDYSNLEGGIEKTESSSAVVKVLCLNYSTMTSRQQSKSGEGHQGWGPKCAYYYVVEWARSWLPEPTGVNKWNWREFMGWKCAAVTYIEN